MLASFSIKAIHLEKPAMAGREGERGRERETARGDRTKENPDMSSATEFYSEILLKTVKSVDCSF